VTAVPVLVVVLCVLALGYRYYSAFLAQRVCALDDTRITPAVRRNDGQNYHPTPKWVLFGHHFAAISGAGPLIGPVLAAQFGYLPGLLWLLVGVVLAGAAQDFVILVLSTRRDGKSLATIVRDELGPMAGLAASIAILFVLVIALAGLGIVVVNALAESAWGTFTLATTIPIALFMGWYTYRFRPGSVGEATVIGVVLLFLGVYFGEKVAHGPWGQWFVLSKGALTASIATYGFAASVLPVWLLLCPRDYLSSFLKIGTIVVLVVAVFWVNPTLRLEPVTEFVHGGGPILPGKVFPFVFITIMCGAISGFHALVASGTTPKMVMKESHCRPIGYGAMLVEALVGIVALIAVANLAPGDYFAINVTEEKFKTLELMGYHLEELPVLEEQVQETVRGRTGGAVSLAIGMARLFNAIPGLGGLLAYWYHFAILFEALFILTVIDTGTRIGRFLLQELAGQLRPAWGNTSSWTGAVVASAATVGAWGFLIHSGSVATLWPMFGIANQLLAVLALGIGAALLWLERRDRAVGVLLVPMAFVAVTTTTGAWQVVARDFFPLLWDAPPDKRLYGIANCFAIVTMFGCTGVALGVAVQRVLASRRSVPVGVPR
jgi:carbon starvation protein